MYINDYLPDIGDSVVNFIKYLETNFACNGICDPGLFFFGMTVDNPPPTSDCKQGIQDSFNEYALSIGAALIISFFFTGLAFFV